MPVKCCRCVWRITQPSGGGFELDFQWNFALLTNQKIKKNWTQNRVKYKAKKKKKNRSKFDWSFAMAKYLTWAHAVWPRSAILVRVSNEEERETTTAKLVEHAHTHTRTSYYILYMDIYWAISLPLSRSLYVRYWRAILPKSFKIFIYFFINYFAAFVVRFGFWFRLQLLLVSHFFVVSVWHAFFFLYLLLSLLLLLRLAVCVWDSEKFSSSITL